MLIDVMVVGGGFLLVLAVIMVLWALTVRALTSAVSRASSVLRAEVEPLPASPPVYTTLDESASSRGCSSCRFWDLEAGQKLMALNPAFMAASNLIPPWRMGRALKLKPNPEHLELLNLISEAPDEDRKRELRAKLDAIPAEIPLSPEEQVQPELLDLEWSQFGACKKHQELRAGTDNCDLYQIRLGVVRKP